MNKKMQNFQARESKSARLQSTEKTLEIRLQSITPLPEKHISVSTEFLGGRFDIKA